MLMKVAYSMGIQYLHVVKVYHRVQSLGESLLTRPSRLGNGHRRSENETRVDLCGGNRPTRARLGYVSVNSAGPATIQVDSAKSTKSRASRSDLAPKVDLHRVLEPAIVVPDTTRPSRDWLGRDFERGMKNACSKADTKA